jgi:hypothetical protein
MALTEMRRRAAINRRLLEAIKGGSIPLTPKDWQKLREEVRRRAANRAQPRGTNDP